jgi:hypothetical protein
MNTKIESLGRTLLIFLFLYFTYQLLSTQQHWIFFDFANLLIHEAGHLIFSFFGQFIYILGGSFMQIAIPCTFFVYFLRRKEFFSTSVMLFWISDNVINVSIYMKDAQTMQLPLLGGDSSIHDWNWLFNHMGLLGTSNIIGNVFFFLGVLFLLTSLAGMIFFTAVDFLKSQA